MKKVLITMAVLASMVAGAMVLSSFTAPKKGSNENTSVIVLNDDGWEDWAVVCATGYIQASTDGRWIQGYNGGCDLRVQRRESCGEKEFRIYFKGNWYPVHNSSPVEGYNYCFYYLSETMCFRM